MIKNEDWINIGIAITIPKDKAKELEGLLKPYADELKWDIFSTDEDEQKSQLSIAPKSGRLSPQALKDNLDKIAGVGFGILKDIVYLGDKEKALQNYMQGFVITSAILPKTKREVFFLGHTIGFLWFNYEVSKRLALEESDKDFAVSLFFDTTAEDELKDFFAKKKPEETDAEIISKLESIYGFNLTKK